MNQHWAIWYRGSRKGFMLQKLERIFGKKALSVSDLTGDLNGRKINVLKFEVELSSEGWESSILESFAIAEKLNPSWCVSGVTRGEIVASGADERYEVSDIEYAQWSLRKTI